MKVLNIATLALTFYSASPVLADAPVARGRNPDCNYNFGTLRLSEVTDARCQYGLACYATTRFPCWGDDGFYYEEAAPKFWECRFPSGISCANDDGDGE